MSAISYSILTAVSWVFTALAVVLTAARFWIRWRIIKKFSWDDGAHLLGLLLLIVQVSTVSAAASLLYATPSVIEGDDSHFKDTHLSFVQLNIASILATWCCLYAIKMSFLLLYHRIFRISELFIRAWWIVFATVALAFLISIAGTVTQCGSPLALEHVGTYGKFPSILKVLNNIANNGQRVAWPPQCYTDRGCLSSITAF